LDRLLNDEETKYILSIKEEDVTDSLLKSLFAKMSYASPARFNTNDYFMLPAKHAGNNKEGHTTIGLYILNIFLIQPHYNKLFGYVNRPVTGPVLEEIEEAIAKALYTDQIDTHSNADFFNRLQWLGGSDICTIISPSFSNGILKPPAGTAELKAELIEANKEAIAAGDAITGAKIERILVDHAVKQIQDDPGFENFASGAKASLDNNYKTMVLMKGPLASTSTGEYSINFADYNTGIPKSEYVSTSDSAVSGAYARSTAVAVGGYLAKRSHQTLNTVQAGPAGSDCGTDVYLHMYLEAWTKEEYLYRYIKVGKELVLLTEDNYDMHAGTVVNMRSAMFCHMEEPCYCNKCIGEQPYMFGLKKFGLAIARLSNTLLNLNLKMSHSMKVKLSRIDMDKLFHWKN
jgi:hypothetical protein